MSQQAATGAMLMGGEQSQAMMAQAALMAQYQSALIQALAANPRLPLSPAATSGSQMQPPQRGPFRFLFALGFRNGFRSSFEAIHVIATDFYCSPVSALKVRLYVNGESDDQLE